MRIISGKKRGTNMMAPEGGQVRPTADRVREGLFNILSVSYTHLTLPTIVSV